MPPNDRRDLALSVVVSALLLALVWAEPRPIDDLFIALAGGRDVLAGKLGGPDTWSFTTAGRVWLNQNWGSHVLFYATWAAAGTTGLLVLKALLLTAGTACMALAGRARGASAPVAVLIGATMLAASRSYVDLRPSLVGLVLASAAAWTLGRAASRPAWLWITVALVGVWANMHGSFIFGLALLGLFAVAVGLAAPRRLPAALAAGVVATALAGFANPFGLDNLKHPFVVGMNPIWRTVAEWTPLFTNDLTAFGSRWEACTVAAVFLVLLLGRLVAGRGGPTASGATEPGADRVRAIFDALAVIVVAAMAVGARRFVPLALVVIAGPLAATVAWWLRRLGSAWPLRLAAVGLAAAVVGAAPPVLRRYSAENPIFGGYSTFENMIDAPTLPTGALDFLRANDLSGRAYAAWEWEGYLRWNEAPVTVFIGGRAQQVYDEVTLQKHKDLRTGTIDPRAIFKAHDVSLAILPLTGAYANVIGKLIYTEESPWTYLYSDGRTVVLGDKSHPALAKLLPALEGGTIPYATPEIATTTRMMYEAAWSTGAELDAIRQAAEKAAATAPNALAYATIGDVAMADRSSTKTTREYLAGERERLARLAAEHPEPSLPLTRARLAVARTEATLVGRTIDPEGVQRTKNEVVLRAEDLRKLYTTWAYGWDPNLF
jgi:hypothetical protein